VETPAPPANILVAVAQPVLREALTTLLERDPRMTTSSVAADGASAVFEADRETPDVAIVDLQLPNCDPVRTVRELRDRTDCQILVLGDAEDGETFVDAIEAGARACLTRDTSLEQLLDATAALSNGESVIERGMLGQVLTSLVERQQERETARRVVSTLTRREREVLVLVASGQDNEQVARTLVISPETVRTHMQNALAKLGLHSRLEAASFVIRTGVLDELEPTG